MKYWKQITSLLLIIAMVYLLYPYKSYASFSFSRSITVNSAQVPSTQTNFPMLVSGTYSYLATVANGGKVQNANGYDIGFYSNSDCVTGKLNWETETYNATTGTVNYWINVASISNGTVIYMCYGDASISTDQSNATAVWDTSYKGVWHLPNGTSLTALDSTSNGNNGTLTNTPTATAGKIDGASNFVAASSQYIDVGNSSSLKSSVFTYSAWVYDAGGHAFINSIFGWGDFGPTMDLGTGSENLKFSIGVTFAFAASYATPISANTWTLVSFTYDSSGNYTGYVNGASVISGTSLQTLSFGNNLKIGRLGESGNRYFDGNIDEFRVSDIVRTPNWITTEYNNQSAPASFYTIGSENNLGGSVTPQHKFVFTDDKFVLNGQNKYIFQ